MAGNRPHRAADHWGPAPYWRGARKAADATLHVAAPERTEIEPGAIRGVLADAFILALDRGSGHPIRLAGTRLCALFGREIKGKSFLDLWTSTSQAPPWKLYCRSCPTSARHRPERKRRVGRARTVAAPAQHSPADFPRAIGAAGVASWSMMAADARFQPKATTAPAPHSAFRRRGRLTRRL